MKPSTGIVAIVATMLLIVAWLNLWLTPVVLLLVSVADVLYFLFRAPSWCGAVNRNGTLCRNNSSGLLVGCHLRQHKWQRLQMVLIRRRWPDFLARIRMGWPSILSTANVVAAIISSLAAVAALLLKK